MTEQQDRAREYLRQAEEAQAKAKGCKDPEAAEGFRIIAVQWRKLARRLVASPGN